MLMSPISQPRSTKIIPNSAPTPRPAPKSKGLNPVSLSNEGDLTIEMERVLNSLPDAQRVKADKVLEINVSHEVFKAVKAAYENDKDKLNLYTDLLYNQALLIEGLEIEDPVEFTNNICKLMM